MSDSNEKVKQYREEQSLKLIDKYKDIIEKTFAVVDIDILQDEIDKKESENNEGKNDKKTEQTFLNKINARMKSLDAIQLCLDKIDSLERTHLMQSNSPDNSEKKEPKQPASNLHPSKQYARNKQ